ncbi:MAG: hypothetical protein B7Z31_02595 [Rhodobacterales bacterium 12-65-15]|nr:MAG: hypothetical protein B7Z31_02595 [Rhodobacterales bacterium 12-65-15]
MKFLIALLVLLLIEIALFVVIGGQIGLWLTLAWVILAGGLGLILLKGVAMMGPISMSRDLFEFQNAASLMPHRVLLVIAGTLLLFPGFFSDAVGLLLLIQPIRRALIHRIGQRFAYAAAQANPTVTDAEWVEVESPAKAPIPQANKTQH